MCVKLMRKERFPEGIKGASPLLSFSGRPFTFLCSLWKDHRWWVDWLLLLSLDLLLFSCCSVQWRLKGIPRERMKWIYCFINISTHLTPSSFPTPQFLKGKLFSFFLRKTYKFYLPSDCPDLTPSFADLGVENAEISQNVIFSAWRDFAHSWAQLLPTELLFVRLCKQFQVAVNCRAYYLINHFKTRNA